MVRDAEQISWHAYENGSLTPPITAEEDYRWEAAKAAKELCLANGDGTVEATVIDEIMTIFHQKDPEELDAILASSGD